MDGFFSDFKPAEHLLAYCLVGSEAHGVSKAEGDRDYMGVYVEPELMVLSGNKMESQVRRTAGEGEKSGEGDVDETLYSLRHWTKLAMKGNPTALNMLFSPPTTPLPKRVPVNWDLFEDARRHSGWFRSEHARNAFLGYAMSQRLRLQGKKSRDVTRPELIKKYGYDTKYAFQMVRLGLQGWEFLTSGRISVPIKEPHRTLLMDIREGKHDLAWVIAESERYDRLIRAVEGVPEQPNQRAVYTWMRDTHRAMWGR